MTHNAPPVTDGLTPNPNGFDHRMFSINLKDMLDRLLEKKAVTTTEHQTLNSMISSPDMEDFYLALSIIKVKKDGIKIQSKNTQV